MKKVTAFIGTQTKRNTYNAVKEFEENLEKYGQIDFEYLFLNDYDLEYCRGCKTCFDEGGEYCPIEDDRDILLDEIEGSDGVVFATPSYAFQLSARMKNFLDRTAYMNHRPRYFDKAFTAIVTYGAFGGGSIVKYLSTAGENLGFHVSKGCSVRTLEPMTERSQEKLKKEVKKSSDRFYRELTLPEPPAPSFLRLAIFRMTRTSIKSLDSSYRDYQYFSEEGWFDSDYYYPVKLWFPKKLVGYLSDFVGGQMIKRGRGLSVDETDKEVN
ncbi:flavodoxin family protein [Candidatus Bipolaricaulota bacterium]|nr:flavodoxin family protein [Candidatus Bipolaricaulota bacterium]